MAGRRWRLVTWTRAPGLEVGGGREGTCTIRSTAASGVRIALPDGTGGCGQTLRRVHRPPVDAYKVEVALRTAARRAGKTRLAEASRGNEPHRLPIGVRS